MSHRISEERHQKLLKLEEEESRLNAAMANPLSTLRIEATPSSRETIDEKITGDLESAMDSANRQMIIAEQLDGKSEDYINGFLNGMDESLQCLKAGLKL